MLERDREKNSPKRLRYYQGNIDLDLISKGEDYRKLAKSYIIFICTFDLFDKGRHKYTFQNICLEDNSIMLNDEAEKIILNTKGIMNDLSDELLEFLAYVEDSRDDVVANANGNLIKSIHNRVQKVKNDVLVEVHILKKCEAQSRTYLTLLERDREKIEEGILLTKKVLKLSNSGYTISEIAKECNISEEEVRRILE